MFRNVALSETLILKSLSLSPKVRQQFVNRDKKRCFDYQPVPPVCDHCSQRSSRQGWWEKVQSASHKFFQAINVFHTFIFQQVAFSPYFSLLLDSCHPMRIPGNTTGKSLFAGLWGTLNYRHRMTGGASNEQKGPTMDRTQVWTLNRKSSTRRGVLCYGAEVEAAEPKLPLTRYHYQPHHTPLSCAARTEHKASKGED